MTLRPLVETLPCLGGVTFTLLEVPFVDFSLKVVQGVDLLSLPLVPQAISYAVQASMLLRCARVPALSGTSAMPRLRHTQLVPIALNLALKVS